MLKGKAGKGGGKEPLGYPEVSFPSVREAAALTAASAALIALGGAFMLAADAACAWLFSLLA